MTTEKKSVKRSASGTLIQTDPIVCQVLEAAVEWSNDHEFISPNEIYMNAIGLLYCLISRRAINISFTNLYRRSLKLTWLDLLNRERRSLKSNINSVEKCFMINRLISEYNRDSLSFVRSTGELYEEIKMRMKSNVSSPWTLQDFYDQVNIRRDVQSQRRLFYISHDEAKQPQSLLVLQQYATLFCHQLVTAYQRNMTAEYREHLKQFFQHIFIIVAQPSIPECVAATKYEKKENTYSAKLYSRIICLLDPNIIQQYFLLSNVAVTLCPFDRHLDIIEAIDLKKLDAKNIRPLYSTKLCQLKFDIEIQLKSTNDIEPISFVSQLFGLCSHAQYYPEHVAKVLLHEVKQICQTTDLIIPPHDLTNYVQRYHKRISGVELKPHTSQFITDVLRSHYEQKKSLEDVISSNIYEEVLSKLISQMEMFIDYPFLSMMYHDGLLLGICNNTLDQQLHGTCDHPHILFRFNTLSTHQATHHPSVRFIIHNGRLTRATFNMKAFIDEMCQLICKANSERAKHMRLFEQTSNRTFYDFSLYFDKELYRLNKAASPIQDAYQPLIPVLWNTMKINNDEQELYSPPIDPTQEDVPVDLSNTRTSASNDIAVQQFVDQLFGLLATSSTSDDMSTVLAHLTQASTTFSSLTHGDIEQQKAFLSRLLIDSFATKTNTDADLK